MLLNKYDVKIYGLLSKREVNNPYIRDIVEVHKLTKKSKANIQPS